MSQLLSIITYLGPTIFFTLNRIGGYEPVLARFSALAGLAIVGGATLLLARRREASPVHQAMAGYMLLAAAGFWLWPGGLGRLLALYPVAGLYLVFLIVVLVPLLLGGQLFTMFWAKRQTPEAVWSSDIFLTINRHMTWAWALLFALCGLLALIPDLAGGLDSLPARLAFEIGAPLVLLLGLGAPFNKWYPDRYQRRLGLKPVRHQSATISADPGPGDHPGPEARPPAPDEEREMPEKPFVVAVNGSPRLEISNTGQLIEMFRPELAAAGLDLEVINLAEKEIKYCQGDAYCLDKGVCWQRDDYKAVAERVLQAAAVILASPAYILNVTAQMKSFLDRSLPFGHKPRGTWKPGLAICVSTGLGETEVALYLENCLRIFGAQSIGRLTAMGSGGPDQFYGKELVQARAADLARMLASYVKDGRKMPATNQDLRFYQFMGDLIRRSGRFMRHDNEHWEGLGLFDGFEAYVGQSMNETPRDDPAERAAWLKKVIERETGRPRAPQKGESSVADSKPKSVAEITSCLELIKGMPRVLNPEAAKDLKAVIQFNISGAEEFTAHLTIAEGKAVFHDGPAEAPTLTITAPADVWLGVSKGQINGQSAFMAGQFKANGDFGLLMKMNTLFKA